MSKGQENILENMVQGEKRPTVALFNLGCKVCLLYTSPSPRDRG